MSPADVAVVVVTWEAAELTLACLDGLAAQELGDLRMSVVLVDNASTDGTVDLVATHHPEVAVVRSERNLGFASGVDLGLRHVDAPAVVLLNNDAVPEPGFVRALVDGLDAADDTVAALAATVLLDATFAPAGPDDTGAVTGPDGRWVAEPGGGVRLVNSTGNQVRTDGFGVDRGWLADASRHVPDRDVFGFSGAAAVLRTAVLAQVGDFDERFFMYYEDTDLSWRLRLAGFRVEHCADALVRHRHSASAGEGSELFRFHDTRNRLATLTKNASLPMLARTLGAFALTTASLVLRRRQPWALSRTRLRAFVSYVGMLPHLVRARRAIGARLVVPRRDVERLLLPLGLPSGGYRT